MDSGKISKKFNFNLLIWFVSYLSVAYVAIIYSNICQIRIPVTYVILILVLLGIHLLQDYTTNKLDLIYNNQLWIFLISIILIIATSFSPKNSLLKLICFSLFILVMGVIMTPIILIAKKNNIYYSTIFTLVILFILLTILAILFPSLIKFEWGSILVFCLLGLIVFRLGNMLFSQQPNNQLMKYSSYFAIVLFIFFILYDTKFMIKRAKDCSRPFDYIDNILNLFLDLINIFSEMVNVSTVR